MYILILLILRTKYLTLKHTNSDIPATRRHLLIMITAWTFIIVDALMRVVSISGNTAQRYSARNEPLPFLP